MQQPPTNAVYLKALAIGSELVSMKRGAWKSAEEFQMSELHIHELQAPVARCLPADPLQSSLGRALEVLPKGLCYLFAYK